MRKLMLLTIALSFLTGCAKTVSDNPCAFIVLKRYSMAENMKLAGEIEAAPASALWPDVVTDYAGLRDQVRACKGRQ